MALNSIFNFNLSENIRVEQVKLLYQHTPTILVANLIISLALLFGLWHIVPNVSLIVWVGLLVSVILARLIIMLRYRRNFAAEQGKRFGLYLILSSGMSGFVLGLGGALLLPVGQPEYQAFILFVMVGMGAASVSSLPIFLPAFLVYVPGICLPISIKLISIGEPIQISLGIMTITYYFALSYFGININRSLLQSLKLRFENLELVEQLREQKNEAEQANLSKTKFLAAASHDLRQPLHALTLFTSVLDEAISYPKVRMVVEQINSSVHALQSLFNALLDISRLEAGVMKVEKTDFPLQALLNKLANEYKPQAAEKGLQIICPNVSHTVHSDPALLEQILRNYISNAIRYTQNGEIRIDCEGADGQLTIKVLDTGVGIPAQEQRAIFEEFHQLSNPERDRSKGLGLGLAIVERSAKLLGHAIEVESTLGKGSTFSITVPLSTASTTAITHDLPPHAALRQLDDMFVVVIDDETSVLEGTRVLLETWGCTILSAANKEEALERLTQTARIPDSIIADYRLRDNQTGIEAIHAIRSRYGCHIPALIVTGDIAAEQLREVNDSGLQVLHKPVAPLKLRTFLRHVQLHKQPYDGTRPQRHVQPD